MVEYATLYKGEKTGSSQGFLFELYRLLLASKVLIWAFTGFMLCES